MDNIKIMGWKLQINKLHYIEDGENIADIIFLYCFWIKHKFKRKMIKIDFYVKPHTQICYHETTHESDSRTQNHPRGASYCCATILTLLFFYVFFNVNPTMRRK